MPDMKTLTIGAKTYDIIDDEAVHSAGGVSEAVVWADATATTPEFQLQSKHTNGQELALRIQDNGWMTLYKLTTADDWSTSTTLFDIPFRTITPSISMSTTTGTLNSVNARRFGNVVQILLSVKNSSAIGNNGNIYQGTISQSALRPVLEIENTNYYGAIPIFGWITTGGVVTIRNESSSSLPANTNVTLAFTYLIA